MKDYSVDLDQKSIFILNYKIDKGKIIYKLANGDVLTIPYTKENEEKILSVMESQVNNSSKFLTEERKNFIIAAITALLGLTLVPFFVGSIFNFLELSMYQNIICGLGTLLAIGQSFNVISSARHISDVRKNKYFLEHEGTLNARVKDNENMLYNTHSVTRKQVNNTKEDRVVFTINSVDKIPFSDLEQIMENVKREDAFDFDYPVNEEEKKKGLLK